jgi:hypothetical protein
MGRGAKSRIRPACRQPTSDRPSEERIIGGMGAVLERFLMGLSAAATSPLAVIGYAIACVGVVYFANVWLRAKAVEAFAKDKSEENRRLAIQRFFSELPKAGLTSGQYLQNRRETGWRWLVGGLIGAATLITITAIQHQPPPQAKLPIDPEPNPAVRVDGRADDAARGVVEDEYSDPDDKPKTVGVVELVDFKEDRVGYDNQTFKLVKVTLRNNGKKPVLLSKFSIRPIESVRGAFPPATAVIKPISRIIVPVSEYTIGEDMVYEMRDPIQIVSEDTTAVELLFCKRWSEKGQPLPITKEGEVPIRSLGRGEKELSVEPMRGGGIWGYIKLHFGEGNMVVTKMVKIS